MMSEALTKLTPRFRATLMPALDAVEQLIEIMGSASDPEWDEALEKAKNLIPPSQ